MVQKMLSKQTKQKDEWLYWQPKLLQQEGKNNQSNAIFKSLQQNLGFYPMLAARKLGISYRPIMLSSQKIVSIILKFTTLILHLSANCVISIKSLKRIMNGKKYYNLLISNKN